MSETSPEFVEVFVNPEDMHATAVQLLEAAGDTPEVVATVSGGFRVPADVAAKAGITTGDDNAVDVAAVEGYAANNTAPAQREAQAEGVADAPAGITGGQEPEAGQPTPAVGDGNAPEPKRAADGDEDGELKGEALDAALRKAGLSTGGRADEKRARLEEHLAKQ